MPWFAKKRITDVSEKKTLGQGVFRRCDACGVTLLADEFTQNHEVCPSCHHHYPLSAEGWIELLLDPGSFEELDAALVPRDPLNFVDEKPYPARIEAAQRQSAAKEAIIVGRGSIGGKPIQFGVFVFRFMGGSMGSVVGEKITRLFERAAKNKEPAVVLSSSGGARMQEGVLSLMQMAKTVAALGQLREAGVPFISVLLHPTTGGVAASFALLGDVNIAEPRALIGFAGPRVIENTIRQKLPEGFQRAEFLLEHGMIDLIAQRREMRSVIARVISHLCD
ncbi:MAG: acetyl-CoA carboxylase, carboxyltransferase subunit beta [Deltaproteobacteria bacterium]|nr:acetyl-CoA carboxylase, carboxyltransferase subunit beta [Deltaproteobacteria bacterium]